MNGNPKPKTGPGYISFLNRVPIEKLTFRQLHALKSGRDEVTHLNLAALKQLVTLDELQIAETTFSDPKLLGRCLRWRVRGLSIGRAIQKVFVEQTISHSARKAQKKNRAKLAANQPRRS